MRLTHRQRDRQTDRRTEGQRAFSWLVRDVCLACNACSAVNIWQKYVGLLFSWTRCRTTKPIGIPRTPRMGHFDPRNIRLRERNSVDPNGDRSELNLYTRRRQCRQLSRVNTEYLLEWCTSFHCSALQYCALVPASCTRDCGRRTQ